MKRYVIYIVLSLMVATAGIANAGIRQTVQTVERASSKDGNALTKESLIYELK